MEKCSIPIYIGTNVPQFEIRVASQHVILKKKNLRYANSFTFGPVSPTHHSTRVHICRCRFLALLFCRANLEMLKKYSGLFELRAREAITGDNVLESWVKKYLNVSIDVKHNLGIQSTLFIQVHVPNAMYQI